MKQALLWMFVCLAMSGVSAAQAAPAAAGSERMFFPHDMFWGYGQFDLAPPHNEIDPNICRADAGISGGVNAPCNEQFLPHWKCPRGKSQQACECFLPVTQDEIYAGLEALSRLSNNSANDKTRFRKQYA